MNSAPKKCPLCFSLTKTEVWNGLDILICLVCSLAWRATFDLPHNYYQTINVDSEVGKKKKRERNTNNQVDTLKKFLPPSNIWDLGAGDGTFLLVLRNRGYKDCFGLEPGENGLKISKERNLNVFQGKISDFSKFASGKEEVLAVTLFHLLEHLDDPKEAINIISKVLSSHGFLIMETPDSNAPIQRLTDRKNHLVYPDHLFYWNERSLKKLLEQSGFRVIVIKHRSFDWRNAPIKNSLLRLGLIKNNAEKENKNNTTSLPKNSYQSQEKKDSLPRRIIRTILAHLVHLLRCDDYLLVVAQLL